MRVQVLLASPWNACVYSGERLVHASWIEGKDALKRVRKPGRRMSGRNSVNAQLKCPDKRSPRCAKQFKPYDWSLVRSAPSRAGSMRLALSRDSPLFSGGPVLEDEGPGGQHIDGAGLRMGLKYEVHQAVLLGGCSLCRLLHSGVWLQCRPGRRRWSRFRRTPTRIRVPGFWRCLYGQSSSAGPAAAQEPHGNTG